MQQQEAFRRLNLVRDEFDAARFSLAQTLRDLDSDPNVYHAGKRQQVTHGQLQTCAENLQITYLVRLFAEFEAILRDYWLKGRHRRTEPGMEVLMDRLGAYCTVTCDDLQDAHEVRAYRNDVIHAHLQNPRFDFHECRSRLAHFVRWLPLHW